MSEIEFQKDPDYMDSYIAKCRMPSGMTTEISFLGCMTWGYSNEIRYDCPIEFHISLHVYKKRKDKAFDFMKNTGKDGLATLLFARKAIVAFESFVEEKTYHYKDIFIVVGWEDNRRRNVYERGLKSLGFEFGMLDNKKHLIKKISHSK